MNDEDIKLDTEAPTLAEVRFAILLALPSEFVVAEEMIADDSLVELRGHHLKYKLTRVHGGPIGKDPIIVALYQFWPTGNSAAAATTAYLASECPNLKGVIMCGIAGGIPKLDEYDDDVRLGDIVVSEIGIIQYDYCRDRDTGKGHSVNQSPYQKTWEPGASFLDACKTIKQKEIKEDRPWLDRFKLKQSIIPNCERPNSGDNQIYVPRNIIAMRAIQLWAKIWGRMQDGNQPKPGWKTRSLESRHVRQHDPRVHYGAIASGNRVLRDYKLREHLRREYQALAVEMEGAGVMNAASVSSRPLEYIVVRGISDYCDPHKTKGWQTYAAGAAAAYVHALLTNLDLEAPKIRSVTDFPDVGGTLSTSLAESASDPSAPSASDVDRTSEPRISGIRGAAMAAPDPVVQSFVASVLGLRKIAEQHDWQRHAESTIQLRQQLPGILTALETSRKAEILYALAQAFATIARSSEDIISREDARSQSVSLIEQARGVIDGQI